MSNNGFFRGKNILGNIPLYSKPLESVWISRRGSIDCNKNEPIEVSEKNAYVVARYSV